MSKKLAYRLRCWYIGTFEFSVFHPMEAVAVLRIARYVSSSFVLFDSMGKLEIEDTEEWFLKRGVPYPNIWVRDNWVEVLNVLTDLKLEIRVRQCRINTKISQLSWWKRHVFTDELESLQGQLRSLKKLDDAFSITEV